MITAHYKYNFRLKLPIPLSAGQFLCHCGSFHCGLTSVVLYVSWLLLLLYGGYFTIYMKNIILSPCHAHSNKRVYFLWYFTFYYVLLLCTYHKVFRLAIRSQDNWRSNEHHISIMLNMSQIIATVIGCGLLARFLSQNYTTWTNIAHHLTEPTWLQRGNSNDSGQMKRPPLIYLTHLLKRITIYASWFR